MIIIIIMIIQYIYIYREREIQYAYVYTCIYTYIVIGFLMTVVGGFGYTASLRESEGDAMVMMTYDGVRPI